MRIFEIKFLFIYLANMLKNLSRKNNFILLKKKLKSCEIDWKNIENLFPLLLFKKIYSFKNVWNLLFLFQILLKFYFQFIQKKLNIFVDTCHWINKIQNFIYSIILFCWRIFWYYVNLSKYMIVPSLIWFIIRRSITLGFSATFKQILEFFSHVSIPKTKL